MNIILSIITSLLIIYVRIRIINTIFSQKKIKLAITLKVLWLATAIVGSLFIYKYILGFFGQSELALTPIINIKSLILFVVYCTSATILITIFFRNRYKKILQIILIWSIFFIGIAYGGYFTWINLLILYYLVAAYAEEYMKYTWGTNMFLANKETNESNMIFFCILVWLWFSVVENILYTVNSLINHESVNILNIVIGRGLVSTLIHIVSTALIAFIIIKAKKIHGIIIPTILGIMGWFWLHSIYNISLQYNLTYVTIPMVVLALFLMTYLTFQSDIIYSSSSK